MQIKLNDLSALFKYIGSLVKKEIEKNIFGNNFCELAFFCSSLNLQHLSESKNIDLLSFQKDVPLYNIEYSVKLIPELSALGCLFTNIKFETASIIDIIDIFILQKDFF